MKELPIIRTSERSSFKRCPQQWVWGWVEGLRKPEEEFNAAYFGTGIHLALAEWYVPGDKRETDPRDTWRRFIADQRATIRTVDDDGVARYEDAADLGDVMLEEYLKEYGNDDDWEIISPEMTFSVLIPHPAGGSEPIGRFVGTIDIVARRKSDNKLFLWDHKTCAGIPGSFEWLDLDDQASGYQAVATFILREKGLIGPKESVRGMVYNYLRKARPDDRPRNALGQCTNKPQKQHYIDWLTTNMGFDEASLKKLNMEKLAAAVPPGCTVLGEVSKNQPSPLFHREVVERTAAERKRTIKRLGEELIWMEEVRSGRLPVIKRTTQDCKWCNFFDLCTIDEQGDDTEHFKKTAFLTNDPYADHRDGAKNSKTTLENKIVTGVR